MAQTSGSRHTRLLERLSELGLALPVSSAPAGSYVPAILTGPYVHTSGQLPLADGCMQRTGKVGESVSVDEAKLLARTCVLNAFAAVAELVDLDDIVQVVKVVGFVASAPSFNQQPQVINGASDLLLEMLGERGKHARSAVGVAELPLNAPVEIEFVFEIGTRDGW